MICNKDRYGIFKKSPARCSGYLEPKIFIIAMKEKTYLFPLKFCSFQWIRTTKAITKTIGKWDYMGKYFTWHCTKNEASHWGFIQYMWPNPHFPTDLVTFTEKNFNEKLVWLEQEKKFLRKMKDLSVLKSLKMCTSEVILEFYERFRASSWIFSNRTSMDSVSL